MNCMWTCFEIFVVIFGELAIGCELRTMDSVILCRLRLNQLETIGGLVDSENGLLSSFILQVVYVFEYCYTLPCRYGFSCHWMLGCLQWSMRLVSLTNDDISWYNHVYDGIKIIDSCGEFSNVPLLGTYGGINYNPVLERRQLGFPLKDKPNNISLEGVFFSGG